MFLDKKALSLNKKISHYQNKKLSPFVIVFFSNTQSVINRFNSFRNSRSMFWRAQWKGHLWGQELVSRLGSAETIEMDSVVHSQLLELDMRKAYWDLTLPTLFCMNFLTVIELGSALKCCSCCSWRRGRLTCGPKANLSKTVVITLVL